VVTNIEQLAFMLYQKRWKPNIIYTKEIHAFLHFFSEYDRGAK